MPTFALIDFETTGLSPDMGDRPTELAVLLIEQGRVVEEFSSLMNPGIPIPYEVQHLTGITNAMVAKAPPVGTVLKQAMKVIGDRPLVAHNASFDRRFWRAETEHLRAASEARFACTMLLARRLYPEASNHRLGTLVRLHRLPAKRAHRALADVEMTFHLWSRMDRDVRARFGGRALDFELMCTLQKAKRDGLEAAVTKHFARPKANIAKVRTRRRA
ncbi:MAG: PolC-type DNA polymerase III [Polyangiales bacterium]